jgi:hypothetical protein
LVVSAIGGVAGCAMTREPCRPTSVQHNALLKET